MPSPTTFSGLVGAYLTHQLSDEDFQTALSVVRDLPPWLKSKPLTENLPPPSFTSEQLGRGHTLSPALPKTRPSNYLNSGGDGNERNAEVD